MSCQMAFGPQSSNITDIMLAQAKVIRQLCCANKCHKAQDCPAFAYAVNFIGQYVYPFDTN